MVSRFASNLANVATSQHAQFRFLDEDDDRLCKQIKRFWDETVGGFQSCTTVPWSAVFVSWCVKKAGATTNDFKFAGAHSIFVHDAINDPRAFKGIDIPDDGPEIGDILQNNRGGTNHGFAFAKRHANYPSHSAIVVRSGRTPVGATR